MLVVGTDCTDGWWGAGGGADHCRWLMRCVVVVVVCGVWCVWCVVVLVVLAGSRGSFLSSLPHTRVG